VAEVLKQFALHRSTSLLRTFGITKADIIISMISFK